MRGNMTDQMGNLVDLEAQYLVHDIRMTELLDLYFWKKKNNKKTLVVLT